MMTCSANVVITTTTTTTIITTVIMGNVLYCIVLHWVSIVSVKDYLYIASRVSVEWRMIGIGSFCLFASKYEMLNVKCKM